ncbi:hypothetical protein WN943_028865 [Citrus x changshan-huyou]
MNVGKPEIWLTLGGDNPLTVSLSPLPSESNDLQQNWKGVELFYIDMNMMTPFVTATKSQPLVPETRLVSDSSLPQVDSQIPNSLQDLSLDDDYIHTAGNGILNQQHGWRVACENTLAPKLIDIANTQANLSDADPDEITLRLEISSYDPQWVVKSKTWY